MLLCLLSISAAAKGQDTIRQYLNFEGKLCAPEVAYSYRIAIKDGDVWYSSKYYIEDQTIATEGSYLDDSLKIKMGSFINYYPDGKKKETCRYINDKKYGLLKHYNKKGQITDSTLYINDIPSQFSYNWYDDGHIQSIGVYDKEGKGTGTETNFYKDSSIDSYGIYSEGHAKDSIWTYYYKNGAVAYREYFEQGKLLRHECFDDKGLKQAQCDSFKLPDAGYPVDTYLANNLHFPDPNRYILTQGKVRVAIIFVVNEDGSIGETEVAQKVHPVFDEAARNVIRAMPKWKSPGKDHNRPRPVYFKLPIVFRQQ